MAGEPVGNFKLLFQSIDNGYVFEKLAQQLMSAIRGAGFRPLGGNRDFGMDGLEYVTLQDGNTRLTVVHQYSIAKDTKTKINRTIRALSAAGVEFDRLVYGTNAEVKHQHQIAEECHSTENVIVDIFDVNWFELAVKQSKPAAVAFNEFARDNVRPTQSVVELVDVNDPRIYVYLLQSLQSPNNSSKLDELLVDTLIFRALEGTDPDKGLFRTKHEILDEIQSFGEFDSTWLDESVSKRLNTLSSKPNRLLRHHRKDGFYCLPYETRVELAASLLRDRQLYDEFRDESDATLRQELDKTGVRVRNAYDLLKRTFEDIYRKQGLEFSQFIRDGDAADAIDKSLVEIVEEVVDGSQVIPKNRTKVKRAVVQAIREIVYNGSPAQLEVLLKFSSTYLLLFLLQYDPKLVSYFESVTERLVVYVDTSILVPAMSEYFLEAKNQRYSNLLKSANAAGVKLYVTETVISELSAHFYNLKQTYNQFYNVQERLFEDLEFTPFVPEILLRSYFYAKSRQIVASFEEFYSCFTSLADTQRERELYNWIHDAYGISFQNYSDLSIEIDPYLEEELFEKLKDTKNSPQQARNDVKQLLMIYALRDKNSEVLDSGAFGYRTWWLTSDTKSQRAFQKIGGTGRHKNPYIRADFLYNFLTLAPNRGKVDAVFRSMFPNLLGVNISFHVPDEIGVAIREQMLQHSELVCRPGFRGKLSILLEDLMGSPTKNYKHRIDTWFEQWNA